MNDPMPYLKIIPKMGWDTGLNLEIVNANITVEEMEEDPSRVRRLKYKATPDSLILSVKRLEGENNYYLGFVPEDAVFVLVPAWIFREEKA